MGQFYRQVNGAPTVRRVYGFGGWEIYSLVGDHLVTRRYLDYTRREALAMYRREVREMVREMEKGNR